MLRFLLSNTRTLSPPDAEASHLLATRAPSFADRRIASPLAMPERSPYLVLTRELVRGCQVLGVLSMYANRRRASLDVACFRIPGTSVTRHVNYAVVHTVGRLPSIGHFVPDSSTHRLRVTSGVIARCNGGRELMHADTHRQPLTGTRHITRLSRIA